MGQGVINNIEETIESHQVNRTELERVSEQTECDMILESEEVLFLTPLHIPLSIPTINCPQTTEEEGRQRNAYKKEEY